MDIFDVYITAKKRDNKSKIDYSVLFVKNGLVWYRFTRRVIDKYKIGGKMGYVEAVKLALKFAKEHNIFANIYSTDSILNEEALKYRMGKKNKASKECKQYFSDFYNELKTYTNYTVKFIKPIENPYFGYLRKLAIDKFRKIS